MIESILTVFCSINNTDNLFIIKDVILCSGTINTILYCLSIRNNEYAAL